MKIKKLTYHNKYLDWQLEPLEFSNLNLLVGASGVGKTRILKALTDLKRIASGESLNGVAWDVEFSIKKADYQWSGEFETLGVTPDRTNFYIDDENNDESRQKSKIIEEKIVQKQKSDSQALFDIVDRKQGDIYFHKNRIPVKLSAFESVLKLFSEDDHIIMLHKGFAEIITESDISQSDDHYSLIIPSLAKQHNTLEAIKNNAFSTSTKLALAYKNIPEIFSEIKENFIDVFPEIEDMTIKFKPHSTMRVKIKPFEEVTATRMVLYFRIRNVDGWISHDYLSAGMMKSLTFIADMYLCPEGTVILIDEFENSLGVNCINILDDLVLIKRNLQYIITSHHPYIINNVPVSYWKIITRKGSVVKALEANELNLGKSKHEVFMQLMQLDEFTQGVRS